MSIVAGRPSTMSSLIPVDFPENSMIGQQRQQISELQFDKFTTPSTFLCWKIRFKNQGTTCSDFPSEAMLWIREVEMVDSLDELKSSRSVAGKNFPNFEMLIIPGFPVQEEGQPRGGSSHNQTHAHNNQTQSNTNTTPISSTDTGPLHSKWHEACTVKPGQLFRA